ncbi:MAG: thioredoxin [Lachnospiraceae bacterium]|nr:thioredoxin [Lachnospiraceae bacterium]
MDVMTITSENFEKEVLQSAEPVLIDFWASWCGPCRMLSPIVDQVAEEATGGFKVGKVNVDDEGELAEKYGIMNIPCLIVFKDGQVANKSVGMIAKPKVEELVKSVL